MAIGVSKSIVEAAFWMMLARAPSSSAVTLKDPIDVLMIAMTSPIRIRSPSDFSQEVIVALSKSGPGLGMRILIIQKLKDRQILGRDQPHNKSASFRMRTYPESECCVRSMLQV